jgi:hypothetical protein
MDSNTESTTSLAALSEIFNRLDTVTTKSERVTDSVEFEFVVFTMSFPF